MGLAQLTAIKHIQPLAAFVADHGEPLEPLLRQAGLPSTCLNDPKTLVPTVALWRFRELAASRMDSPNLTLAVMASLDLADLGAVARAVLRAPTLLELIRSFQRLSRAESSTATSDLKPCHSEEVFFSTRFELGHEKGEWQAELYLLAWMLKIVWVVDATFSPREIWCIGNATPERIRAIESLTARPRFSQPCIGFPVPASMLALPRKVVDSSSVNRRVDEATLWSTSPGESAADAMRQVIRAYSEDRWLTLEQASEAVGASVRTVQRELAREGETYSGILEEARGQAALELLEDSEASLSEISRYLGYSNLSNFNRAFRRWAAVSPREVRAARARSLHR
jgi:AraC-like DNA-binding protein